VIGGFVASVVGAAFFCLAFGIALAGNRYDASATSVTENE